MDTNLQYTGPANRRGEMTPENRPASTWLEVLLSALPFLLILLLEGLPMLLDVTGILELGSPTMSVISIIMAVPSIGAALAILILAWRRRWPVWSATWFFVFCYPLLFVLNMLFNYLTGSIESNITQGNVMYIGIPLALAVLLYAAARNNPLRGLLAPLTLVYFLWTTNMEFVPNGIELGIKAAAVTLVYLTIAVILRLGDWKIGLYAFLVMNLLIGALFSFGGTYYGGTLPFTAPGPNLVEVARSMVPQLLATSAILLGPLFAWKFREIGRSAGRSGKIAYHIALAGLLLVIMANLMALALTMESSNPFIKAGSVMGPVILVGVVIYLAGVIWLYWLERFSGTAAGWAARVLLALLPLGIPLTFMSTFITWKWPMSPVYGVPLLWELPHIVSLSIGLVWLALSVWVVTRDDTPLPAPAISNPQPAAVGS